MLTFQARHDPLSRMQPGPEARRLQLACMGDFSRGDWPELIRQQRRHRHCFSGQCHEFNFIAGSAFMEVNDRTDVASLQAFVGEVSGQYYAVVFLDHESEE